MSNYGDIKYWVSRYQSQKGTTFDWLQDYDSMKEILEKYSIDKDSRILNVGCGNSEIGEKLYEDKYKHIYNIDICQNVIDYMKERNKNKDGMHFDVMDVRSMAYKNEIFDLIIDKATMDTILCGENSFLNVAKMTKEISRVLKNGGIYLILSIGKPEDRIFHLQREHLCFDIQVFTIKRKIYDNNENYSQNNKMNDDERIHYGYICRKLPEANENIKKFDIVCSNIEKNELRRIQKDDKNKNIENQSISN